MAVIQNSWIEKERRKKGVETAPSYLYDPEDTWQPVNNPEAKRHTNAARAIYKKSLRGIRK